MQSYPENSPEAMAQLLTALMAADDRIDDAEIEALSVLDAYARIGITPPRFADVLRDYFADIDATGGAIDPIGCIGARITAPRARAVLWEIMSGLAGADDDVNAAEIAFLQRVATAWWDGALPALLEMPGNERTARTAPEHALHESLPCVLDRGQTRPVPARAG